MSERGFDDPPRRVRDRLGSRAKAWVLVHASRTGLTALLLVLFLAAFIAVNQLPGVDLVAAMRAADPVSTLFQALVGALITGVTLVVTIAQLVLSQELGPLRSQRQRMEGAMDFRSRAAELLHVPAAPPEPSSFLRALSSTTAEHAGELLVVAERQLDGDDLDDRPAWEEVRDHARAVQGIGSTVAQRLDDTQFGEFAVVDAALDMNYSWQLYVGQRLAHDEDGPLADDAHEGAREHLVAMNELLALFGPTREHIKTLYFEWELINLSRRILAIAGPAILVAVCAMLLLDAPAPPTGSTFGIANAVWLVGLATTVSITPFTLFASYLLRIVTIAKLTLAAGPFILREVDRQHEVDWGT